MKKNTWVASCDWFAISCIANPQDFEILESPNGIILGSLVLSVNKSKECHPYYECSACLSAGDYDIAHVFWRCKRPEHRDSCLLKVANNRLYYTGWAEEVRAILKTLQWRFHHIARVDVCCDFNFFANGRLPLSFVQDYLAKPRASRPSFVRRGSNKFRAFGEKSIGNLLYETLSWGTRESAVQVNLYNKSIELKHTNKPWIRDRWESVGLLDGKQPNGKVSYVWRVEFSLNPCAIAWKNTADVDKVVREVSLEDVATQGQLSQTFASLLPRYFQFYYLSPSDVRAKKRVRDLTPVVLFTDVDNANYTPTTMRYFRKSTRADRNTFKRLCTYADEKVLNDEATPHWEYVINDLAIRMRLKRPNLGEDLLSRWLQANFSPVCKDIKETQTMQRSIGRLVRMLQGVHDKDCELFMQAISDYEEMTGDNAFKAMLAHANDIGSTWLPDAVISESVDQMCDEDIIAADVPGPLPDFFYANEVDRLPWNL